MSLAPIVLFVYNRVWHTRQTVEALKANELAINSDLFIYCDAAKNENNVDSVVAVREYVASVEGFLSVTVIERERNFGLAESIIDGVTSVVNKFENVIVLEDDLVTSPLFLKYMNDALKYYEYEETVASIHGYVYPIEGLPQNFFLKGADCWGWGVWKRAWDKFEPDGKILKAALLEKGLCKEANFNNSYDYVDMLEKQIAGENDSWAVRWYMSAFILEMVTLYPGKSYVDNIGNDDSGTHSGNSEMYSINLKDRNDSIKYPLEVIENTLARKKFEIFFRSNKVSFIASLINKIKEFFK